LFRETLEHILLLGQFLLVQDALHLPLADSLLPGHHARLAVLAGVSAAKQSQATYLFHPMLSGQFPMGHFDVGMLLALRLLGFVLLPLLLEFGRESA
jgi:hypothetical protein